MTYKNNFVVCVKVNGKIMRDTGEEVFLPFGSEYSLLLKNLESRKAVALISIDGKPMDHKVIVDAHSEVEVERFIEQDLNHGYKLRFIEKTTEISEYRGDHPCDGLVTVEYWFEQKYEPTNIVWTTPVTWPEKPWHKPYDITWNSTGNITRGSGRQIFAKSLSSEMMPMSSCFFSSSTCSFESDEGITVKGEDSNQAFRFGNVGLLESSSHTITLKLKGLMQQSTKTNKISAPLYVNTRLICSSCGKSHKSSVRFCSSCGTRLV